MSTKTRRKRRDHVQRKERKRTRRLARKGRPTEDPALELSGGAILLHNPPGMRKLSEAVMEFAQPLIEEAVTGDDQTRAIEFAIIAWNLGSLSGWERAKMTKAFHEDVRAATGKWAPEVEEYLTKQARRKRREFPDDNRIVLDYELLGRGRTRHLNVVYSP